MYQKIKAVIFGIIYLLLGVRLFVGIYDPGHPFVIQYNYLPYGLPIFQAGRGFFDLIYVVTDYLMAPIYWIYHFISPYVPPNNWFPGIYTYALFSKTIANVSALVEQTPALTPLVNMLNTPVAQQSLLGYIDLLIPVAMVFYSLINPVVDWVLDFLKNAIWNVLIEMTFTKRKESKYQQALEKRAADLMKLNVEYKNLSKEASMLAASVITDELTKVYNKRFFINKITYEFQVAKDKKALLCIAMVDIDHFKKLNDNYGHLMGDKVLQAVAHVAKSATPNDCFCCRFGGEEFSIIMPGKTEEEAVAIISQVHRNLPLLRFEEDPNLRTSASFGICVGDFAKPEAQDLKSFEDFIKHSDDMLYQAKLNGRNRIEVKVL